MKQRLDDDMARRKVSKFAETFVSGSEPLSQHPMTQAAQVREKAIEIANALSPPRWEWRASGRRFGEAKAQLAALTPEGTQATDSNFSQIRKNKKYAEMMPRTERSLDHF